MDYEKKYNEALERARKIHDEILNNELLGFPDQIREIFPELRESEDERIRRELIEYLRGDLDDITTDDTDRWITWIEKQENCILVPKSHLDPVGLPGVDGMKILEKQKEQKEELVYRLNGLMQDYIEEGKDDEEKEHRLKCYRLFWDALEDANFFEQKEQKPAEKQDYSGLNDLERTIHRGFLCAGVENVPVTIIKDTAAECMGFLALIEPKPAEWSEEDESCWNLIWDILDGPFTASKEGCKKAAAWFLKNCPKGTKSLRPSWKPSEEQMDALEHFIGPSPYGLIVAELHDDLQKLL